MESGRAEGLQAEHNGTSHVASNKPKSMAWVRVNVQAASRGHTPLSLQWDRKKNMKRIHEPRRESHFTRGGEAILLLGVNQFPVKEESS